MTEQASFENSSSVNLLSRYEHSDRNPNRRINCEPSKNHALPLLYLAASLKLRIHVKCLPFGYSDVRATVDYFEQCGMNYTISEAETLMDFTGLELKTLPWHPISGTRYAVLLMTVNLIHTGSSKMILGGGCNIATSGRGVNYLAEAFIQMGAQQEGYDSFHIKKVIDADVVLAYPSVSATFSTLFAMCGLGSSGNICNCAVEPEIQSIISTLFQLGFDIEMDTENRYIQIRSIPGKPRDSIKTEIIPDRIHFATYAAMSISGYMDVEIKNVVIDHNLAILTALDHLGASWKYNPHAGSILVMGSQELTPKDKPMFHALPYPGLPTDALSFLGSIALQRNVASVFYDSVFPTRTHFFDQAFELGYQGRNNRGMISLDGTSATFNKAVCRGGDLRSSAALISLSYNFPDGMHISDAGSLFRGYTNLEEWKNVFNLFISVVS